MRWLAPRMLRVQQRVQLQIVGVAHRFTEVGMHSRLDRPESVTHAHLRLLACGPLAPECALKLLSSSLADTAGQLDCPSSIPCPPSLADRPDSIARSTRRVRTTRSLLRPYHFLDGRHDRVMLSSRQPRSAGFTLIRSEPLLFRALLIAAVSFVARTSSAPSLSGARIVRR